MKRKEIFKDKKSEILVKENYTEIEPLKDFHIVQNKFDIKIFKGVKIDVPNVFLQNLITEKVIKGE